MTPWRTGSLFLGTLWHQRTGYDQERHCQGDFSDWSNLVAPDVDSGSISNLLNRSSSRTGHATEANDNMAAIIFRDVIPKLEVALALACWADSPIALFLECHQVYSLYNICSMCVYIYIYTCSFLQENPLGDALGYLSATFLLILAPCLLRMGWIKNDPYSRMWSQIQKSISKRKYSFWFSVRGAGAVCALLSASCYQSRWVDCSVCNPVGCFQSSFWHGRKSHLRAASDSFPPVQCQLGTCCLMISSCLVVWRLDLWKPKKSHSIQD